MKPGINDDQQVRVARSNDLWFRGMENKKEETELQRDESSLGSDGFAQKAIGQQVATFDSSNSSINHGRFEQGPGMITKIHAYLVKELNLAENAEGKVSQICE